jgi:hypothetical protein
VVVQASCAICARQRLKVVEGRISTDELQELLRFALREQEFFDFDSGEVRAAIGDQYPCDGNVFDSNDATTTSFRIQTADGNHEVTWAQLDKAVFDFPEVERLLQLHALDQRLSQVFYVVLAGGQERVNEVVAKVNELAAPYYRRNPDVPPLTAADLFKITSSPDGSQTRFTFSRKKDKLLRHSLFEVSIDIPQEGEPTIGYIIPPT